MLYNLLRTPLTELHHPVLPIPGSDLQKMPWPDLRPLSPEFRTRHTGLGRHAALLDFPLPLLADRAYAPRPAWPFTTCRFLAVHALPTILRLFVVPGG